MYPFTIGDANLNFLLQTDPAIFLDNGPRSKLGPGLPVLEPVGQRRKGDDKPEKHVDKVHPNGMLHSTDITVTLRVLVDVHLRDYQLVSILPRFYNQGYGEGKRTSAKTPKTAIQRIKRIKSHTHLKANRRTSGIQNRRELKADRPPTTTANTYISSC